MTVRLPAALDTAVQAELDGWRAGDKVRRLWSRDASLWTGADEASWLGWLGIAGDQLARASALRDARRPRSAGRASRTRWCSGWAARASAREVLATTFGRIAGHPELFVLDSTDPGQIRALERQHRPRPTRSSSCRASPAARSSRTSSCSTSSIAPGSCVGADRGRQPLHRDHRSRLEAGAGGEGRPVPPRASRRAVDRRALLGAVGLRHGAGGGHGSRRRARSSATPSRWPTRCGASVPPTENPGRAPRGRPGRARAARPRQGHAGRLAGHRRSRRLARAAPRRVHRQGRARALIPVDREPLGPPARVRRRPAVRLRAPGVGAGPRRRTPRSRRSSAAGQPVVRIDVRRSVRPRRRVLPLGDRDRGRRRRPRRQPLRPARRRGEQGRDARADRPLRDDRRAARRRRRLARRHRIPTRCAATLGRRSGCCALAR